MGIVTSLTCEPAEKVLSVRRRLSKDTSVPVPLLKLILHGEVLEDECSLASYNVDGSEDVLLVEESAARLVLLPGFNGLYQGEEEEGKGHSVYEMTLDSLEFVGSETSEAEGVIHWKYLRGQRTDRIGRRARELVRGVVHENGSISLKGYHVA